jgi:prepilin-type N-terminal cleavage/methylation domain-containing protein
MTRRGFTIVELIITITIMGILLTLAVVNVGTTQAKARDDSRKSDIESIASNLESFYIGGTDNSTVFQAYPSTSIAGGTAANITSYLRDADINSFLPPGTTNVAQTFLPSTNPGTSPSIQTTAGVLPLPTKDTYVYQPIASDGSVCTGSTACRKYNLFYRLEADNTVYRYTSKNQ